MPSQIRGTIQTSNLVATVSLPGTYTYEWKASVPGTFTTPVNSGLTSTTTFTPDDVNATTQIVITCVATDAACARSAFDSKGTALVPSVPMLETKALSYSIASNCDNNTFTFNLFDSVPQMLMQVQEL